MTLEQEAQRLDETIRDVISGRFESELERLNPCGPCLAWDAVRVVPRTIHHPLIADIVASSEFQNFYRQLRSARYVLERMDIVRANRDDYPGMLRWLSDRLESPAPADGAQQPAARDGAAEPAAPTTAQPQDATNASAPHEALERHVRDLLETRVQKSSRSVRLLVATTLERHKARIRELSLQAKLGRAQVLDGLAVPPLPTTTPESR